MKTILDVKNLSIRFPGQSTDAVQGLSFSLNAGETLAIVGESGSGKSVSALSLLKLLPEQTDIQADSIVFQGKALQEATEAELRSIRGHRISYIFQEPMTSLNPLHTIEKQIAESLKLHKGLSGSKARERVLELLTLVGIPSPVSRLKSYPHELSGGQRQRVMIAMALANEPEILIADEPTTALDVTIQKQILDLLMDLQQKLGMAILIITHDLNIVKRYADRIIVMQQGKVVEQGDTLSLFNAPNHPYTHTLLNAEPVRDLATVEADSSTLLEAKNIRVWFPKSKGLLKRVYDHIKAVDGIDLQIKKGETLGIVGESGSGKSTLAFALLKLTKSEGEIHLDGTRIDTLNQKEMRPHRRVAQIVFQDPFGSLSPRMTIAEIISEGLEVQQSLSAEQREVAVIQALQDVQLDPESRHRYPHEFSGGQRQRIAIARALVLRPKLIVLDEPTSALDRTVQKQVIDLLQTLQRQYQLSYLFISHDLAVIKALSHRVMVMKAGKVLESGTAEAIFNAPSTDYTRELIFASALENMND
jgi:microcin C transport system ATP-binding protein